MKSSEDLRRQLRAIDHKSYPAYKDLRGSYNFGNYTLGIDHVQGDPFASPSRLSIQVDGAKAGFPPAYYRQKHCRIALQDYLNRLFYQEIEKYTFKAKGSGKSGLIAVSRCGQEILERSAVTLNPADGSLLVRFAAGFPANGRTINAPALERILFDFLPSCVQAVLFYRRLQAAKVQAVIHLAEDQHYIRTQLPELGLCAFVANGSVLPRQSGVSDKPMKDGIPFVSPASMEVTLTLPHHGPLTGMGIRKGITLIVGGGYHGKSTLLEALELGVYNHIAGDGREYVITQDDALKIRAEDGRSIKNTDISMFINNLPNKKDTKAFCTEDASGSTSQAANVIEGMESGTSVFLIDEDTCATNFMIRDELMQREIHRDMEPITPFMERIRELYEEEGISTVIVAGSSGAYFHIADCIVQMDRYMPKDITQTAKKEAEQFPQLSGPKEKAKKPAFARKPQQGREWKGNDRIKMKTLGKEAISINRETIDLRYVEQITDSEQVTALGYCVKYAQRHLLDGTRTLQEVVAMLEEKIEKESLAALCESTSSVASLARPRTQEIFACFDRYRGLKL